MDNRYFKYNCPAIWSDSRNLTNYYNKHVFEQFIRNTNKIESAQEYKHFLQNNAETLMSRALNYYVQNNTCSVDGKCVPLKNDSLSKQVHTCNCKNKQEQ
jgi:hypothetical protein